MIVPQSSLFAFFAVSNAFSNVLTTTLGNMWLLNSQYQFFLFFLHFFCRNRKAKIEHLTPPRCVTLYTLAYYTIIAPCGQTDIGLHFHKLHFDVYSRDGRRQTGSLNSLFTPQELSFENISEKWSYHGRKVFI